MRTIRRCLCVLALAAAHAAQADDALDRAQAAFAEGEFDTAASLLEQARDDAPGDAELTYWLGRVELRRGHAERAQALFEQALQAAPRQADFHYWYGQSLAAGIEALGRIQQMRTAPKMRRAWQQAVELDPQHVDARFSLMMYYLQAPAIAGGGREKALAEVEEIRKRDPGRGYRALAAVHRHDGEFDQARAEYEAALAAEPDNAELLLEYAFFCQSAEDWPCAFKSFAAYPDDGERRMMARYQVGRTAVLAGEGFEQGEAALREYLAGTPRGDDPSLAWAHVRLGNLYEAQGRLEDAREQYRVALDLDSAHSEARKALAALR
jgi:Tfp pilus assembly protein PilF